MQNNFFDVAIVGSGPSGVHAAYPLIEAGLKVVMIDGGLEAKNALKKTDQLLKIKSNIEIAQSLAKGGLSEIWPGICDFFSKEELTQIGLPINEVLEEYKEITDLIKLDLEPNLDIQSKSILNSDKNIYRLPLAFHYRTGAIVEKFKKFQNFTYIQNQIVSEVNDNQGFVEIRSFSINNHRESSIKARFLILAAGNLNTTRILLRSFNLYNRKVPFLTKGNYMIISLNPKIWFKKFKTKISPHGQVAVKNHKYFIQFYKANPSSFNKALPYIALPTVLASFLFRIITPFLEIADVRFTAIPKKTMFSKLLKSSSGDVLEISFRSSKTELQKQKLELLNIKKKLLGFGLIPFKILKGSVTYHYAGGIPIKKIPGVLSCDFNGKLHQAKRIYIADSSTWRALPAKPPTLTIMANARRVGKLVLKKVND